MDCRGCRYYKNLADNHCLVCDGSSYTKPTNYDRIRSMDDVELAEFLAGTWNKIYNYLDWLDWLKQEAKDG